MCRRGLSFIVACSIGLSWAGAFADSKAGADRQIREELLRLEGGEREAGDAAEKLRSAERARVIAILKEELLARAEPQAYVLRGVSLIEARELWPELKRLAARSDRWQVFSSINHLLASEKSPSKRAEITKIYVSRLGALSGAAKLAVLEGLSSEKVGLSKEAFQGVIGDEDFQVRIAGVRHFFSTQASLDNKERVARFQALLTLKPYQARLAAMKAFLKLDKPERARLRSAIKPELCANETNGDVRAACRELMRAMGDGK